MRIMIIGAGGFIGRRLARYFMQTGHRVVLADRDLRTIARDFPEAEILPCDLATDAVEAWLPRLIGIDAVINAAGIFTPGRGQDFAGVHTVGPCRLFDACAAVAIPHLVQISALGADETGFSAFHRSKRAGDEYLATLADERGEAGWIVLRPAMLVGRGGGSTTLFAALAALPFPLRIGAGTWTMRPLAIADFVIAVAAVLAAPGPLPRHLNLVGARSITTDAFTEILRSALGLKPARFITLPGVIWRLGARIGDHISLGLLSSDSLAMLQHGHPGWPEPAARALNWRARPLEIALAGEFSDRVDRIHARLFFLRPALRLGLGVIWLASGLVSTVGFPIADSAALVGHLGIGDGPNGLARATVYAGAGLDVAIGCALLAGLGGRRMGRVQIGVILLYTVLATIAAPALWLNPFGPLTKNIAMVLAILVQIVLEDA